MGFSSSHSLVWPLLSKLLEQSNVIKVKSCSHLFVSGYVYFSSFWGLTQVVIKTPSLCRLLDYTDILLAPSEQVRGVNSGLRLDLCCHWLCLIVLVSLLVWLLSVKNPSWTGRDRKWNLLTRGVQGKAEKLNHRKGKNGAGSQKQWKSRTQTLAGSLPLLSVSLSLLLSVGSPVPSHSKWLSFLRWAPWLMGTSNFYILQLCQREDWFYS